MFSQACVTSTLGGAGVTPYASCNRSHGNGGNGGQRSTTSPETGPPHPPPLPRTGLPPPQPPGQQPTLDRTTTTSPPVRTTITTPGQHPPTHPGKDHSPGQDQPCFMFHPITTENIEMFTVVYGIVDAFSTRVRE